MPFDAHLQIHMHRISACRVKWVRIIENLCSFFKTNSIWFSTPTHLSLFDAICPRRLNRVSRRLKRIGEEETGYHKPFYFDFKKVVSAKWNLLKTYCVNPSCVHTFQERLSFDLEFRGQNSFKGGRVQDPHFLFSVKLTVAPFYIINSYF